MSSLTDPLLDLSPDVSMEPTETLTGWAIARDCDNSCKDDSVAGSSCTLNQTVTRLLGQRRYSSALVLLAAAPAEVQMTALWFYLEGSALAHLGRYRAALASFEQALQRPSAPVDQAAARVSAAVCHLHLNQPHRALAQCNLALALAPNEPQVWLFRGVALRQLGQFRQAYRCYDQALGCQTGLDPQPASPGVHWQRWLAQLLASRAKRFGINTGLPSA